MAQQHHLTKLLWIALICVPIFVCMCIWAPKPRSTENLSIKETKITLTAEQAAKIRQSFDTSRFFSLNCYDEYTRPPLIDFEFAGRTYRYFHGEGPSMKDGAFWVLEGYDHGTHRVLVRQSPGEDAVKQLATLLMNEAKLLPVDTREIY